MYSEYAYDNAQFLKSERDPRYSYDGGALVKQYTYDTVRGLLKQETDLNGQTYQHTYDNKTDEMKALASTENAVTLQNDFSYMFVSYTNVVFAEPPVILPAAS